MGKYFAFKDNVILVHGVKKGLIQDLNKEKIFSIDENSKYYLNKLLNGTSIENIVIDMSEEIGSKFIKYLELLIENELGYYSDKKIISGKYEHEKCVQRSVSTVWLELRKACNLNCCHCYMDCNINSDFHLKLLTINKWKCIIDELEEFKPKKIIFIGGEPLLFKNIIELMTYVKLKCPESEIVLYSNLTLLTDELVECLLINKIKVVTSIYSNIPEIHDKITKKNGSFLTTTNNIKKLRKFNIYVQANTVIMKYNYKGISDIQNYTYELTGVIGKVDIIRDIGFSKKHIIPKELYELHDRVKTSAKFMPVNKEKFLRNYSGNSCWQGKLNITCDGNIGPCIMQNSFIKTDYNVRKHKLNNIISDYIIPEFWILSKDYINVCKDCEYRYVCNDCRPMNIEGNNKYSKGKFCKYNPRIGKWENYSDFRGDTSYEVSPD